MGTHCHLYINSILKDKKKKQIIVPMNSGLWEGVLKKKSIKEMTKKTWVNLSNMQFKHENKIT